MYEDQFLEIDASLKQLEVETMKAEDRNKLLQANKDLLAAYLYLKTLVFGCPDGKCTITGFKARAWKR